MFDSIRRVFGGGPREGRSAEITEELVRLEGERELWRTKLEAHRRARWDLLFPDGPVAGFEPVGEDGLGGHFPELDPANFEETEPRSFLIAAATGIIDNFPGSATLLSQLDKTFEAFCDANFYRVRDEGPYSVLIRWRDEVLRCWDLELDVPLYVAQGGGSRVLGCKRPLVVLDRYNLDPLRSDETAQRFMLATTLGHVFFGNLKIFAFYRLMEMIDKLPSMTGLITRGLGMIPGVGGTISRGLEIARSLNEQVIRKTNLVVGQRQHVLCDRLAVLTQGASQPAHRYLAELAIGGSAATDESTQKNLIEQGREVHERFEVGEIDLTMLSIVGPTADFAAYRAFKLHEWEADTRSGKLAEGYFVTRSRLAEYQRQHRAAEDELRGIENKVLDIYRQETKLREELTQLEAAAESAERTESE